VLRNDAHTALAVALTTGAQFIRVNILTGAMVTDQGIIEGEAHSLQMYRRQLMAQKSVKIFADVLVKHAYPLAPDADIALAARDTVDRGLADAVIVTGTATGYPPSIEDLRKVHEAVPDTPVLVGSGATAENAGQLLAIADGIIVASSLKRQGMIDNPVDVERVRTLVNATRSGMSSLAR